MTLTVQDAIFLRAVDLGCDPQLRSVKVPWLGLGRQFRWVCPCKHHEHAENPSMNLLITQEGLDRLEFLRVAKMKEKA